MSRTRHLSQPPDLPALLATLRDSSVKFIVVGSAAAKLHGVELQPSDLDIVPDLEPANRERLVVALNTLEASVGETNRIGEWQIGEGGEWYWSSRDATDAEKQSLLSGDIDANELASLDHQFHTKHGNLDIVPMVAGEYTVLAARANTLAFVGVNVQVAHLDDLLSTLTVPRRTKDAERVRSLRKCQRKEFTR